MFLILLAAEVILSLVISWCVIRTLGQSVEKILHRITSDETSRAWLRLVKYAVYVAGVSGGVGVTEKDIGEFGRGMMEVGFAGVDSRMYMYMVSHVALEICGAIIGTLRGIFWFLAYFLIVAALAFVIIRVTELIKSKPANTQDRA